MHPPAAQPRRPNAGASAGERPRQRTDGNDHVDGAGCQSPRLCVRFRRLGSRMTATVDFALQASLRADGQALFDGAFMRADEDGSRVEVRHRLSRAFRNPAASAPPPLRPPASRRRLCGGVKRVRPWLSRRVVCRTGRRGGPGPCSDIRACRRCQRPAGVVLSFCCVALCSWDCPCKHDCSRREC